MPVLPALYYPLMPLSQEKPRAVASPRSPSASRIWAGLPLAAGVGGALLSLPLRADFHNLLAGDASASLAATLLARSGQWGFSFPYGPLILAVQRLSLWLPGSPARAFTLLGLFASFALAMVAAGFIWRCRLAPAPSALLTAVVAVTCLTLFWVPIYELEPVVLLLALLCWSGEAPRAALFCCAAGILVKPSMAVVLSACFAAFWLVAMLTPETQVPSADRWRRLMTSLRTPALALAGLILVLIVWLGFPEFLTLLSPLPGMLNHQARHYSFFTRWDNPYFLPGMHLVPYYFGTPLAAWALSILALAVLLLTFGAPPRAGSPAWMRWTAAWACLAGTLAFIGVFFSWKYLYPEYFFLAPAGVAVFPSSRPRRHVLLCWGLALLSFCGIASSVRECLHRWRTEQPSAATAGLWARPADAAAWQRFTMANPPRTQPLLLLDDGSPEVLFPAYGPPWHGYAVAGEATPLELRRLAARIAAAQCVAYQPGTALVTPDQVRAIMARQPHGRAGDLFDTYGCR